MLSNPVHEGHLERLNGRLRLAPEVPSDASRAASHVAMIKRFARFTLSMALIAIVMTAIMAIRVAAWFPLFHH